MKNKREADWFIRAWVQGELPLDTKKIVAMAKQFGIEMENKNLVCAVVRYARNETLCEDIELLLQLQNMCRKACKNIGVEAHCYIGNQLYVVVVMFYQEKVTDLVAKLYDNIKKSCEYSIQIGVGRAYSSVEMLNHSYIEAYESLTYINEDASVYYAEDIYMHQSITTRKLGNEKKKIIELFKSGELHQAQHEAHILVEKIRKDSPIREGKPYPTSIRRTFMELIVEIMNISADAGVDVDAVLNFQDPYRQIFAFQTTPEIMEWFFSVMQVLHKSIALQNAKTEHNILTTAKRIINDHICDPELSLTLVGESLGITPTYLSAFFIREMGVGFNEYISRIRIEHAKEQLLKTNKKINDIAMECGFRSSSYFIVVFRKQVGISPGAYRNMK